MRVHLTKEFVDYLADKSLRARLTYVWKLRSMGWQVMVVAFTVSSIVSMRRALGS